MLSPNFETRPPKKHSKIAEKLFWSASQKWKSAKINFQPEGQLQVKKRELPKLTIGFLAMDFVDELKNNGQHLTNMQLRGGIVQCGLVIE